MPATPSFLTRARRARVDRCRALIARIEALPKAITYTAFFARAGVPRGYLSLMRMEREFPADESLQALEDTLALLEREGEAVFMQRAERCALIAMAAEARARGRPNNNNDQPHP